MKRTQKEKRPHATDRLMKCATHGCSLVGRKYPADRQAGTPLSSTHPLRYRFLKYLAIGRWT